MTDPPRSALFAVATRPARGLAAVSLGREVRGLLSVARSCRQLGEPARGLLSVVAAVRPDPRIASLFHPALPGAMLPTR